MSTKMMIGVVKHFERATRSGIISPEGFTGQEGIRDVYFEATDDNATVFRPGQLVKFSYEGSRALGVAVLSEKY